MYPSPTFVGMSTDESPESEIRKRTTRACDSCYKRKVWDDSLLLVTPSGFVPSVADVPCLDQM